MCVQTTLLVLARELRSSYTPEETKKNRERQQRCTRLVRVNCRGVFARIVNIDKIGLLLFIGV